MNVSRQSTPTQRRTTGAAWARRFGLATAFAAVSLGMTSTARAWWNDEWTMRKPITVDTSSTGADITDPIGTAPLLVRLHAGNFRFAAAKPDGSDLRFVAGDDKQPLKYHIEKFDSLLGEGLVWVSVPNIQPGAKANIWLYYGNQKAVAGADDKGSFDADTVLVYHFAERGTPAQDSSVWANGAQSTASPAEGALIGTGLRLDGQSPVVLPASPSLAVAAGGSLTWSAWIKPAALQRNAVLYGRRDGQNGLVIGLDDGAPFVQLTENGTIQRSAAAAPVAPGGWHHVALTATPGLITLYLDGAAYATLGASLPALTTNAALGGETGVATPALVPAPVAADPAAATDGGAAAPDAAQPSPVAAAAAGFAGDIDEMTLAKAARGGGFIRLTALNQGTNPSKLMLYGVDEEASTWLSGYFGVLIRAVTFDGWVVIGILMVMGLASWVVMVEKNGYMGRQAKANGLFIQAFRRLQRDLTRLADETSPDMQGKSSRHVRKHSALYHIYKVGAEEIGRRFPEGEADTAHHAILSAEAIAAIRAALDAALVRESQALNRLMVILTLSIAGGPFLGLLGTVIGVMITFAAIAMSGDVNINAIAPGIAGALMATVAGLVVAIPALFGYNWLTLRIGNLTADMQVFVDEFTAKMAETYSAERPRSRPSHQAAE